MALFKNFSFSKSLVSMFLFSFVLASCSQDYQMNRSSEAKISAEGDGSSADSEPDFNTAILPDSKMGIPQSPGEIGIPVEIPVDEDPKAPEVVVSIPPEVEAPKSDNSSGQPTPTPPGKQDGGNMGDVDDDEGENEEKYCLVEDNPSPTATPTPSLTPTVPAGPTPTPISGGGNSDAELCNIRARDKHLLEEHLVLVCQRGRNTKLVDIMGWCNGISKLPGSYLGPCNGNQDRKVPIEKHSASSEEVVAVVENNSGTTSPVALVYKKCTDKNE